MPAFHPILLDEVVETGRFADGSPQQYLTPLLAFLLTFFIEWPLFAWLSREGFKKTFTFILLMNLASWPLAMILYAYFEVNVIWVELFVLAAETVLLLYHWRYPWWKAFLFALLLNSASFFIGSPLIFYIARLFD